jgi:hypothetical protein
MGTFCARRRWLSVSGMVKESGKRDHYELAPNVKYRWWKKSAEEGRQCETPNSNKSRPLTGRTADCDVLRQHNALNNGIRDLNCIRERRLQTTIEVYTVCCHSTWFWPGRDQIEMLDRMVFNKRECCEHAYLNVYCTRGNWRPSKCPCFT